MSDLDRHRRGERRKRKGKLRFAAVLPVFALLLGFRAAPAFAQCEMPGTTLATAAGIVSADTASLNAQYLAPVGALPVVYETQLALTQAVLYNDLNDQETTILKRMDDFWTDWLKAWQDMTAQLNASSNDQTRQLNNLFDSSGETQNARTIQSFELKAKRQFTPTEVGCRFDSLGPALSKTSTTARALSKALVNDADDEGNAKKGTPAAKGPSAVQGRDWDNYTKKFCNPDANGASAGCTADGTMKDADVLVSKTVFGKLTYDDMKGNPDAQVAMNALMQNITGYVPAVPVARDALESPAEMEKRLKQRSYSAQMNTVMSMLSDVEAERTPGAKSDEAQQIRQRMGVSTASANPSERELRQAVLEQLWDPGYYVGLGDDPSTATQKEIYLEAYNLMLLYQLVNKEEKISNVYAVQTAALLEQSQNGQRDDQMQEMPIHK